MRTQTFPLAHHHHTSMEGSKMPTDQGRAAARQTVRKGMGGESIAAFAERAHVDPQTLGDFLAGRRWPRAATLGKIEEALDLPAGSLAATGESDAPASPSATPRAIASVVDLTDDELVMELAHRVQQLRHDNIELRTQLHLTAIAADGSAPVTHLNSRRSPSLMVDRAARTERSDLRGFYDAMDAAGEESQDTDGEAY